MSGKYQRKRLKGVSGEFTRKSDENVFCSQQLNEFLSQRIPEGPKTQEDCYFIDPDETAEIEFQYNGTNDFGGDSNSNVDHVEQIEHHNSVENDCSLNIIPELLLNHDDISWLSDMFDKECQEERQIPRDHKQSSDKHNPTGLDKRTLAIDLQDWKNRHSIPNAAIDDLLHFLQKHFVGGRFPVVERNPLLRKTSDKKDDSSTPLRNNIDAYAGSDHRTWSIDICRNGCIAYHGRQTVRDVEFDCARLILCPVCGMQRYSKCSHPNCIDLDYPACNPFEICHTTGRVSSHKRFPMKSMYYRSIAAKFLGLFKDSLKQGNENLLKYMHINVDGSSPNRMTRDGHIIDTADGTEIRWHIASMENQSATFKLVWEQNNPGKVLHECSILYTIFYDGMTIFERDCANIWPMLCSTLNCDPSKRYKLGVGMFMNFLHDVPGCEAEKYLLKRIFSQEVAQLENGLLFTFEHPMDPTKSITVYLQARCVHAHLDTIAYQEFAQLQGAGSLHGCKCGTIKGLSRHKFINRVACTGERGRLHPEHALRQFSMNISRFDDNDYYNNGDATLATLTELIKEVSIKEKFVKGVDTIVSGGLSTLSEKELERIAKNKPGDPPTNQWYNHKFPLSLYSRSLCYPVRDRRVQLLYADCHLTNELYLEYGEAAEDAREQWERKFWYVDSKPQTKPPFAVNGCNGRCALFYLTRTMKVTYLTFDLMHIAKNVDELTNQRFTGHRGQDDATRKLCAAQNVFDFLRYKNVLPPWRGTEKDVITVDSLCNCVYIPRGHKTAFGLRWPCRRNGQLRAKEHLTMLMTYNYYFYSFTSMHKDYRDYYARFADDLCRLLDPCVKLSELKELVKCIDETRGIYEGLFPESEHNYVHHEIVDLVNHIEKFGASRGLQCFGGERGLSTFSSLIAKGGVNPIKGLVSRYVAVENLHSMDLSTPFEYISNQGVYSDFVLKLYGPSERMSLTLHELDSLLKEVINVIETYGMELPLEKSSFYRVAQVYKTCKKLYKFHSHVTLGKWLQTLYDRYNKLQSFEPLVFKASFDGYLYDVCHDKNIDCAISASNSKHGILHVDDFAGIIKDIVTFRPIIRRKAIIKGEKFRCRGKHFREGQPPVIAADGSYLPTNELNNLMENYFREDDYSSWLRVKYYRLNKQNIEKVITYDEMVQLNLVYRLDWKSDNYLLGLSFGDACIRTTQYDSNRRKFFVNPSKCFNGERQYTCLNNVCGSAIGLSVIDAQYLPIVKQDKFHSGSWSKETNNIRIAPFDAVPEQIFFLELRPERINYMYGLLELDPDKTKLFETDYFVLS